MSDVHNFVETDDEDVAKEELSPVYAVPAVPAFNPNAVSNPRDFDERAQAIYLERLAACGESTPAAQAAGVSQQTVRNHRKRDKVFAELEEEAHSRYNALLVNTIARLGIEGTLEPIVGRVDKDQDGIIGFKRVHNMRALELEGKRRGMYVDKLQIDQNVRVGVVVVERPAVTTQDWMSLAEQVSLPLNPLEGLPGIDPTKLRRAGGRDVAISPPEEDEL